MSSLSAEELLARIENFLESIQPIYFLSDGAYIISRNKKLANKILIMINDKVEFVYLTGPLSIRDLAKFLYRLLGLKNRLKEYTRELNNRIKERLKTGVSLRTIGLLDYARFFVNMLIKHFGVSSSEIAKYVISEGVDLDNLIEAKNLLVDQHARSKIFVSKWDPKNFLIPREDAVRLLDKNSFVEFKAVQIDSEKLQIFLWSKKEVIERPRVPRIFLVAAYWELERRKMRYIEAAMRIVEEVVSSKQNVIIALAKKLEKEKRIEIPVDLGRIKTTVGLRIVDESVFAFINTGEYIVKEVVNPRYFSGPDVYIYFPPVDVCVELRQERLENKTIIYPAEAPVLIDPYLHPSVMSPYNKRTVCLGDRNMYVMQLISAAKELASGAEKVTLSEDGTVIVSTEQVLAEILRTAFWVMRYGYKRGAKPHKYATECAGRFGARLITKKEELEYYRNKGVEIIEG